jgi:GT2 family glycosyltransferase
VTPAPPSRRPEITVVVVNWNTRAALLACLESLERDPPAVEFETIVVDNGSADGSAEAVRQRFGWAKVIANRANLGLAAANDQGCLASRGEAVLLANADVQFRPGAVDALVDLLQRRPSAAVAVPKLVGPDGSLQTAAGDLPTLSEALLGRCFVRPRRSGGRIGQRAGFWWDEWPHDEEMRIGHGAEACSLVRRRALAEVGLQDRRFRLDWEGIDWAARAADAGWEVWFCPGAEVVHQGGASIRQARARWVLASHAGLWRYFAKRNPWLAPLVAPAVAARAALKLAALSAGVPLYERAHHAATRASRTRSPTEAARCA